MCVCVCVLQHREKKRKNKSINYVVSSSSGRTVFTRTMEIVITICRKRGKSMRFSISRLRLKSTKSTTVESAREGWRRLAELGSIFEAKLKRDNQQTRTRSILQFVIRMCHVLRAILRIAKCTRTSCRVVGKKIYNGLMNSVKRFFNCKVRE